KQGRTFAQAAASAPHPDTSRTAKRNASGSSNVSKERLQALVTLLPNMPAAALLELASGRKGGAAPAPSDSGRPRKRAKGSTLMGPTRKQVLISFRAQCPNLDGDACTRAANCALTAANSTLCVDATHRAFGGYSMAT